MIDLIDEASADLAALGYCVKKAAKYDIQIGTLSVDSPQKSRSLGFAQGDYVIVNSPLTYMLDGQCHAYVAQILQRHLKNMLKKLGLDENSTFLIVGIGNPDILADSLGKRVVDKIEIDAFCKDNKIFKICPNIFFNTGIATSEIVSILTNALAVDCVIVIDSLATNNISRLGVSFQISSAGLTPGSALKQKGKRLDGKYLGAKCLSFGVPFMIFASDLDERADKDLILAAKDIHEEVELASQIISRAINSALKGGQA